MILESSSVRISTDSLLSAKVDSLEKVITSLSSQMATVTPQAIVQQSHDFYSTSFYLLLGVFALVGIGIPFWVNFIQKQQLKANEDEIIGQTLKEVEKIKEELELKIDSKLSEKVELLKIFSEAMDFYNSAIAQYKEGDFRGYLFTNYLALRSFIKIEDTEWVNNVVSNINWCFETVGIEQLYGLLVFDFIDQEIDKSATKINAENILSFKNGIKKIKAFKS